MTSDTSPRPVSPLRARMIEDMTVRGFKEDTRRDYVRHVPGLCGLYRPVARQGDSGRPASLPTAPDAERHAAAEHQRCGLGPALLLHGDAGPAGSGAPADRRAVSAADTGGAQRRGSDSPAARGSSAEVQGGVRDRWSRSSSRPKAGPVGRRVARLGSCRAQGRRCRFRVHAAADRARQGAQEPALAKEGDRHAMLSPQLLELLRAWWREGRRCSLLLPGGWLFPAATRSSRYQLASSAALSVPPPRPRGSRSACHHTRCATALPRTSSSKMSIFA